MGRGQARNSSLRRTWRRRHANEWASFVYEYADGLFAGVAKPPSHKESNHQSIVVFHEGWSGAMAYADDEVRQLSAHQCTDACERWEAVCVEP